MTVSNRRSTRIETFSRDEIIDNFTAIPSPESISLDLENSIDIWTDF